MQKDSRIGDRLHAANFILPFSLQAVCGHLRFERVRQGYEEIEQLQKEIDEIKKGLGIVDQER